jgi:hypothetical protein
MSTKTVAYEDFFRLAHRWEEQAEACSTVRLCGLSNPDEEIALLNRAKVFEQCAKSLRQVVQVQQDNVK